uniref:Putative secreted protein n=1 Tax=Rhipicephalus microplus TaxID=6941 RepID=A0A6M2DBG2_RHIMP
MFCCLLTLGLVRYILAPYLEMRALCIWQHNSLLWAVFGLQPTYLPEALVQNIFNLLFLILAAHDSVQ